MAKRQRRRTRARQLGLEKCGTGIKGLDEITKGGLPRGRPTLVCGGPGSGKTLLGMEFLVRGIREFNEPGVFMAFEETTEELTVNVSSLGFDLADLVRHRKLALDHVRVERREIEETGEYDLEALFIRLGTMIDEVKARRVVLDGLEALFAALPNEAILRAELRRLFRWLKDKGVTAVISAELGQGSLTRHGLEEYVSDCVIYLDHRIAEQVATRRLRIVKYRGSSHGTNEYPTMIDESGLSVLPISSLGLDYPVVKDRVSTGIPRLDAMLGGKGCFRGTSILVSGTAGSGKTSIAGAFANSTCSRGERRLYLSFEESPDQIIRNMASIGLDLGKWVKKGLLRFHSQRSTIFGLESHLVNIHKLAVEFKPAVMIMDPITNLAPIGDHAEVKAMLTRVIDFVKNERITALFTSLTEGGAAAEQSGVEISSLMDTWILLQMIQSQSERNRILYVLKSRGMAHSNQMREFVLSDRGIDLVDVYTGPGAVYTGTARVTQAAQDEAKELTPRQAAARRRREIEHETAAARAQLEALRLRMAALTEERRNVVAVEKVRVKGTAREQAQMARIRRAD